MRWLLLAVKVACATACSFLVTNVQLTRSRLESANLYLRHRGPDYTNHIKRKTPAGELHVVHNLLHMTGAFHPQPFEDQGVIALFNGEIYNYLELGLGPLTTDGECLLPMYRRYGATFPQHLKGEFAIVVIDVANDLIILSGDVFGIKPFWLASQSSKTGHHTHFGVASYASALERLGFEHPWELSPNTIEVRRLSSFEVVKRHTFHVFDLQQHKASLDDWNAAFRKALHRRAGGDQLHGVYVGLSSGADSGTIAQALSEMRVRHHLFSIVGGEDDQTIRRRHEFAMRHNRSSGHLQSAHIIKMKASTFTNARAWLEEHAEYYDYNWWCPPQICGKARLFNNRTNKWDTSARKDFRKDPGIIGTSHICELAHPYGVRIYMSAMGPDELYADYDGNAPWSDYGGKFPTDLASIFPWHSFFGASMHFYVKGMEYVTGAHGMEGRYPFLDVDLVQEFLWLTPELKNNRSKHPLFTYMQTAGYPVHPQMKKLGFAAYKGLKAGNDSTPRRSINDIMAQRRSKEERPTDDSTLRRV